MNNQKNQENVSIHDYQGSVLNLLNGENYRQYNVTIARAIGSVNAAIMLTELVQRHQYHENRDELIESSKTEGKWFYYTQDTAEERLGLSRSEQDVALKKLESIGLIKKIILGVPGKRHFQINVNKIVEITKYSKKHSRLQETDKLDCRKPTNCFVENKQSNIGKETQEETLLRNPPPLTPPKVEKVNKEIPKEEEDFSFFKEHNFSDSQVKRILKFSRKEIERAFLIFPTIKVKISEFGSFWDILKHPENYSDKPEKIEKLTPQQRLALNHNKFLKEFLPEDVYNRNIDTIKDEGYLVIFQDNKGKWVTMSCKNTLSEKQLREDIKDDISWRKRR